MCEVPLKIFCQYIFDESGNVATLSFRGLIEASIDFVTKPKRALCSTGIPLVAPLTQLDW